MPGFFYLEFSGWNNIYLGSYKERNELDLFGTKKYQQNVMTLFI